MIGNRTRRGFKKKAQVGRKIIKGVVAVTSFVLPGGKVYRGVKAAQKLKQYKRVQEMQVARGQRRAKKAAEGLISLTGKKL